MKSDCELSKTTVRPGPVEGQENEALTQISPLNPSTGSGRTALVLRGRGDVETQVLARVTSQKWLKTLAIIGS